ncbi:LppP/LprE family lipoprotein [Gordonia sp. CPCC 205515]|uniref:LppP/LprE family lipoprotein n=1 Tax=Gordonia sp. CPCC 205515 TaxID=3140791 RepID=UPI003AF3E09F
MSRSRTALLSAIAAITFAVTLIAPAASAAPRTTPGTAANGQCLSLTSSEVQRGLRSIGPPLGRRDLHWVPRNRSTNRTPNCPPIMFAVFDTSGGTVSSPVAVLLFRPGKYLGAANKPTGYTTASAPTPFFVQVTYRWPLPTDPNAAPSGGPVTSYFVALGDTVLRFGQLPPGVTSSY